MAQSGALTWTIDGKETRVANTYFLALKEGLQYTVEYEVQSEADLSSINDQKAYDMALPLMKYAFEHRLYERNDITRIGSGRMSVSRIGVSLFTRVNNGTRGYRVARSLDEVRARVSDNR